jgi:hypothetical protein
VSPQGDASEGDGGDMGVVDGTWAIGELIDAALATQPTAPVPTAPERRKLFTVIKVERG